MHTYSACIILWFTSVRWIFRLSEISFQDGRRVELHRIKLMTQTNERGGPFGRGVRVRVGRWGGGCDTLISLEESSLTSVCLCTTRDDMVDDGKTLAVNYDMYKYNIIRIISLCSRVTVPAHAHASVYYLYMRREWNLNRTTLLMYYGNNIIFCNGVCILSKILIYR